MTNTVESIDKEIEKLKKEMNTVEGCETEVYSRIVGYYRSVRNWNLGKQGEYQDRVTFSKLNGRGLKKLIKENLSKDQDSEAKNDDFWSYSFFYRNTCPNCPPMKEVLKNVNLKSQSFNVDTPNGMEEASKFNIFSAPTVVFFDRNGTEIYRSGKAEEVSTLLGQPAAIA